MDIWIIQNGEKTGPIHDFEVRKKIEAGELSATTPAWHEGIPAWKPLGEIDLFRREFDRQPENDDATTIGEQGFADSKNTDAPEALDSSNGVNAQNPTYLFRRFWARWLDLLVFSALWWGLIVWLGRDVREILENPWIVLFHYIPWFAFESILLHRIGTTPGKWLLGLKVLNQDGSHLSLGQAIQRSSRVMLIGLGFGWMPLAIIFQFVAWFTTKRIGNTIWDQAGGHQMLGIPLHFSRIIAHILIMCGAMLLQMVIIFPYALEEAEKRNPGIKEQWEKSLKELEQSSGPNEHR